MSFISLYHITFHYTDRFLVDRQEEILVKRTHPLLELQQHKVMLEKLALQHLGILVSSYTFVTDEFKLPQCNDVPYCLCVYHTLYCCLAAASHAPIPIINFSSHVEKLFANDKYGFSEEYKVNTIIACLDLLLLQTLQCIL